MMLLNLKKNIPIILISDKKEIIKNDELVINYIITNLIHDDNNYTDVQKEYLFQKGIYNVLFQKVNELIKNNENYNGLIYDLTEIKAKPNNWIFKFESINDTYSWLSRMDRNTNNNFIQKIINFYSDKIYNDSSREINYLTNKVMNIKNNKNIIDIFILTYEELEIIKTNYFFKTLLKNISSNYSIYFINKEEISKKETKLFNKLTDGVIIYEDCVYRDIYTDEFLLGFVDCNKESIQEYNKYFDYVLDKYGKKLNLEGDIE